MYKKRLHREIKHKKLLIFIAIIIFVFILIDNQIRPLIKSIAANKAQIISTRAINEAVIEELANKNVDYSDLVSISRDSNGKVLSISTNVNKTNVLKSEISIAIQNKISSTQARKVGIPIGTLTGVDILSGRGPDVHLKISLPSSVITEFEGTFTSAGINQTKHEIHLNVHTEIYALIPGYPVTTTVDTNIAVAESIIIGDVPKVFANLDSKDASKIADFAKAAD